jgi:hypothetical protein
MTHARITGLLVLGAICCGASGAQAESAAFNINRYVSALGQSTRAWTVAHPAVAARIIRLDQRAMTWEQLAPDPLRYVGTPGLEKVGRAMTRFALKRSVHAREAAYPLKVSRATAIQADMAVLGFTNARAVEGDIETLAPGSMKSLRLVLRR